MGMPTVRGPAEKSMPYGSAIFFQKIYPNVAFLLLVITPNYLWTAIIGLIIFALTCSMHSEDQDLLMRWIPLRYEAAVNSADWEELGFVATLSVVRP
jgi:hypothetical protein